MTEIWDDVPPLNPPRINPDIRKLMLELYDRLMELPNVTMVTTIHPDGDAMAHLADAIIEQGRTAGPEIPGVEL